MFVGLPESAKHLANVCTKNAWLIEFSKRSPENTGSYHLAQLCMKAIGIPRCGEKINLLRNCYNSQKLLHCAKKTFFSHKITVFENCNSFFFLHNVTVFENFNSFVTSPHIKIIWRAPNQIHSTKIVKYTVLSSSQPVTKHPSRIRK